MAIGPVLRAELIRNARRPLAYWLRLVYGVVLFGVVWTHYAPLASIDWQRGLYYQDLARFALDTFIAFMVVQLAALLLLIPALCGGAVADEKQRKTLHYLMASQLTSREIVLDKLLARLLQLGIYVMLGMPVMSLLSLFGGVPWEYVIAGYTATCSIGFFAAALAVLVSVVSRRVRQGVLLAYLLEIGWLIGPPLAAVFVQLVFPEVFSLVGPEVAYGMNSSPVSLYVLAMSPPIYWRTSAVLPFFEMMIALQLCGGLLMLWLSVVLLRPVYRRQEERPRRVTWFRTPRRARWAARPACGDAAMLWKESHFTRTDIFTKLVVFPATIVLSVGLILGSQLDEAVGHVLRDYWQDGGTSELERGRIASALRSVTPFYAALWLLAVASASAACITTERDQNTWVSLISSPLSAREIVLGKTLGAVWSLRGFGVLFVLFWLAGLLLGGVSLLGLGLALLTLAVFTWFVAALGTLISLRAKTTARALTATILLLVALNGGCLVIAWPLWTAGMVAQGDQDVIVFTPAIVGGALTVPERLAAIRYERTVRPTVALSEIPMYQELVYGSLATLLYAAAALVLTVRTPAAFDRISDRPSVSAPVIARARHEREALALSRRDG